MASGFVRHSWQDCGDNIMHAMQYALDKHGTPTSDPVRGAATLAEEVGEVAAEALEATRTDASDTAIGEHLWFMIAELDQVAAYAILLRVSIEAKVRRMQEEK